MVVCGMFLLLLCGPRRWTRQQRVVCTLTLGTLLKFFAITMEFFQAMEAQLVVLSNFSLVLFRHALELWTTCYFMIFFTARTTRTFFLVFVLLLILCCISSIIVDLVILSWSLLLWIKLLSIFEVHNRFIYELLDTLELCLLSAK